MRWSSEVPGGGSVVGVEAQDGSDRQLAPGFLARVEQQLEVVEPAEEGIDRRVRAGVDVELEPPVVRDGLVMEGGGGQAVEEHQADEVTQQDAVAGVLGQGGVVADPVAELLVSGEVLLAGLGREDGADDRLRDGRHRIRAAQKRSLNLRKMLESSGPSTLK